MSSLTPDQLKKIEENRLAALKRRAEKCKENPLSSPSSKNVENYKNSVSSSNNFSSGLNASIPTRSDKPTNFSTLKTANINSNFYSNDNVVMKSNQSNTIKGNQSSGTQKLEIDKYLVSKQISGSCLLISKNRFSIDIPFHKKVIDLFQTVPERMYDAKERKWNFPLKEYSNLMKKIAPLKPEVIVQPLPSFVVKTFLSNKSNSIPHQSIDVSSISREISNQLYPFQTEGIQFAISRNGRCLIADDMGLGKTIQAIAVADYYKKDWPLLIVCPSSMRYQWEEEIQKYIPSVSLHKIFVMKNSKDFIDDSLVEVLITSYDLLGKKIDTLKRIKFGVVILDESHSLKSGKTQRTKAALDIVKSCTRVLLLSGTPALSRPSELFTQLSAINPSVFFNFKEYGVRYCDGKQTNFGWNFDGSSNMNELRVLLESHYMIRRLKKDVIKQLPSKIRQVVTLNSDVIKSQSQSLSVYAENLRKGKLKGFERRGQLLLYFAETAKIKIKPVCDYVTHLLEEGKKFICFAHHKEILDAICQTVHKCKQEYIRIDGSVGTKDRKDFCDKFQYDDKYRVAVLSIKAANTGLTLTSAHLVVFAELYWNPGELTQAEDRAHRIGQQDSVLVQYLIAKDTADDYLWPLVQDKLDVLGKAGLSKDTFSSSNITSLTPKNKEITDYFMNDDVLNEENLIQIMDEVDGSTAKRLKLT